MKKFLINFARAIALTAVIFLFFALHYMISYGQIDIQFFLAKGSAIGLTYGLVLYLVNNGTAKYIKRKYPPEKNVRKFLYAFIIANIVFTGLFVFLIDYVFRVLLYNEPVQHFLKTQSFNNYAIIGTISLLIGLTFFALGYYKRRKNTEILQQGLIANRATAEFESLKAQIDPHFLFNSLNVLASLIEEDQQRAIDYTHSLSAIYRYITEQKDKQLVPLADELAFADSFIKLVKIRFENAIIFRNMLESHTADRYIAPLSLQLLLENAIKHNVANEEAVLEISISQDDDYLIVTNNLQEKTIKPQSTHIGLSNIRQRYALLTERIVHIEKTDQYFRVKIPLLNRP
ncbi:histidine kinase [Sphingobacterium oryzagri]|uniref:Histidine kinase n=1 Tax=Sphingobacterium oryzagri TaxID=3025669 RepID=A0ABY7WE07_9SPHI|nr:histidine kinase [Sphingobacterium sp. KACC 22765]WDF67433.1 histidine kinase [Sphingobacterium sp. KACC 22765]